VSASGFAKSVSVAIVLTTLGGCGKKGPPLPPLRLVPAAPVELTARRSGDDVQIGFSLPTANANGPGDIDLARVEIYAITVGPALTPANRDLLIPTRVVGTINVRPPAVEGETPKPGAPPDTRPGPGERVTFVDQLNEAKKTPVPQKPATGGKASDAEGQKPDVANQPVDSTAKPDAPAKPPGAPAAAAQVPGAPAAAQPPGAATPGVPPPYASRVYAIRGLSRSGRPGLPSARVVVPLIDPIGSPSAVVVQMPTEKAVVIDWTPPVAEAGTPAPAFNVYRGDPASAPLNPSPLAQATFEFAGVELGKEQCFVVRTVQAFGNVTVESVPSAPACLTPLDKFPPAAPKGLRAVAEDVAVSLVWDQNTEADLGGYLVLRGEVPGDSLIPLTPQPIVDANYRDTTVKPGVRYVYVVVAVDTATPRNQSGPSPREEVTAR